MISSDEINKIREELLPLFYETAQYCLPTEQFTIHYTGGRITFDFE